MKTLTLLAPLFALVLFGSTSVHWYDKYTKLEASATAALKAQDEAQAQYMQTPVSVIGLVSCDKYMGTIVITGDGQIHEEDMSADDAHKLAEQLGDGQSVLAKMPCEGQGT